MNRKLSLVFALAGLVFFSLEGAEAEWQSVGYLSYPRAEHTATLLPGGKVLVTGGLGFTGSALHPEIFDPNSGQWSPGPFNATNRTRHTATLLASGRVLIVGGSHSSGYNLDAVDQLDLEQGSWTSTRRLAGRRSDHTATLLPSGKVLVVAGKQSSTVFIGTCELFDSATGNWSSTGILSSARSNHTATLLPSGKVLVVGGWDGRNALASVEVYDPHLGSWSVAAPLINPRYGHTATLLPAGKVLVAGGRTGAGNNLVQSSEVFDPELNSWRTVGNLGSARAEHMAVLLPAGIVLVAGGQPTTTEVFEPVTETWSLAGDLGRQGFGLTGTLLTSGKVLVAGGGSPSDSSHSEIYVHDKAAWNQVGNLLQSRSYQVATVLSSGKILIAGGLGSSGFLGSSELFDPVLETWGSAGNLNVGRMGHAAALLPTGEVLAVGGRFNSAVLSSAEIYDPSAGQWRITASLHERRENHTATRLTSGRILVAGGNHGSRLASAETFDVITETWTPVWPMSSARTWHTATLLRDGRVLVTGGEDIDQLSSAETFDPSTGIWLPTGSMLVPRKQHTATLLPSGRVLVAGGTNGDILASAEIYDPSSGIWFSAGSMSLPRTGHCASLLGTGEVLVTGGSSAEVYDPATNQWRLISPPSVTRTGHTASFLRSGAILLAGGGSGTSGRSAEIFSNADFSEDRRPEIQYSTGMLSAIQNLSITGIKFGPRMEASSGGARNSATNFPVIRLLSNDGASHSWLNPDARLNFGDDPMTLTISEYPSDIDPGIHLLSVVVAGNASEPVPIEVECSLAIRQQPTDQTVGLGGTATFSVSAQGGRRFQWRKDGVDIPNATFPSYTTPPVITADAGTTYSVFVDSLCTTATSNDAALIIADADTPSAFVASPSGGEYWPLSTPGTTHSELVTWAATDNIRVCEVQASLLYSNNSGQTWIEAPAGGGLPATFGRLGPCAFPGVETSSLTYTVPKTSPSGSVGSLYKIRLRVTDQAGNMTEASSANPFFIVQPNPDSVKTLILTNLPRMRSVQGISQADSDVLTNNLLDLSNHPRVQGRLVDLSLVPSITSAYAIWDADPASPSKTNAVVSALRDYLRIQLLPTYTGVESIVIVGDDRIVPMARLVDATLTPESTYTSATTGSLTTASTVGKALSQNYYLSDDLLGIRSAITLPISAEAFAAGRFIPTLAVGRLVETPTEIIKTIATFISKDGVLDLGPLSTTTNHKVLVTGYDFLIDSAARIRTSWRQALGAPISSTSLAPVDGELISSNWGGGNVSDRRGLLRTHLSGTGGATYGLNSLNGHATHFEEGVPGASLFEIQGLSASEIYGPHSCGNTTAINLPGAVVYSVGCHGGLSVPGSCISDADHSLDLPQTMMARGVVGYLANSGYGWGIKYGIGVSEKLVQIFSEELMSGGIIHLGKAVVRSKQRYFLEQPGIDVYDQKTLLQWTYYGLPMYSVQTGIAPTTPLAPWSRAPEARPDLERLGAVTVERKAGGGTTAVLPDYLLSIGLGFNLSAPGIYKKYDSLGNAIGTAAGCSDANGCYYTLNGLVERGSGTPDLPIQPYLVYDSRVSGTSQHGALWLGGDYQEETGWRPVFAELVTNHGDYSNHGSTPRLIRRRPTSEWIEIGDSSVACRPSDLEMNSLVVVAGDALKVNESDPIYSRQRLFQNMDLEAFYFNDQGLGGNCDRQGPVIGPGFDSSYHQTVGARIEWAVSASDAAGVWRVVVVYDLGPDAAGNGRWESQELAVDGEGIWRGSLVAGGVPLVTYMIQAVDRRGNVEWVNFAAATLPASGVVPDLPMPFDVSLTTVQADLKVQVTDAPDPVVGRNLLGYTVLVTNLGPDSANGISVSEDLSLGVVYVAAAGEGWSCSHEAGIVTCGLQDLEVGSARPLSIIVTAPQSSGTLTATATVTALEIDPDLDNNSTVVQTFVTSGADLSITKSDGGALARPGEPLSYTIAATNNGPENVVGARVTDFFPASLTQISWTCVATPGSGCTPSGNGNIVDTVNLLSGGTLIYQAIAIVVLAPDGPVENTATITPPSGVGDPQQTNNASQVLTPIFESSLIFKDGFESGDMRAWLIVVAANVPAKNYIRTEVADVLSLTGNPEWNRSFTLN